jgi:hypothetical protein
MRAIAGAVGPDPVICSLLRRERCIWAEGDDLAAIARFLEVANFHGVLPLLDAELRLLADGSAWPKAIQLACFTALLARRNFEDAHLPEITRVLDALAADGLQPLVLKGGALAHSHYPEPALRPRSDTDLLVPEDQRETAGRTLHRLGYTRAPGVAGELVSYQSLWSRTDERGGHHFIDLHWRISNSQVLARALTYPELAARCVPLPALGASARALAPVDALLLACLHLAGHAGETARVGGTPRPGSDRLIWLYDIHLLAGRLSETQFDDFASLAAARRLTTLCRVALDRARASLGTAIPARVRQVLDPAGPAEPSAYLLRPDAWRNLAGDFLAVGGWQERLRWLGELAFPAADYMRWRYRDAALPWLPLLYLRRACSAAVRHLLGRYRHR